MRILIIFLFLLPIASCEEQGAMASRILDAAAFESMLVQEPNAQLIDVRTPAEFASGHLKGAALININEPGFEQKIRQLDKTKPVMVYCASGVRSAAAAMYLQKQGFASVFDLKGGIRGWSIAGKPLVR